MISPPCCHPSWLGSENKGAYSVEAWGATHHHVVLPLLCGLGGCVPRCTISCPSFVLLSPPADITHRKPPPGRWWKEKLERNKYSPLSSPGCARYQPPDRTKPPRMIKKATREMFIFLTRGVVSWVKYVYGHTLHIYVLVLLLIAVPVRSCVASIWPTGYNWLFRRLTTSYPHTNKPCHGIQKRRTPQYYRTGQTIITTRYQVTVMYRDLSQLPAVVSVVFRRPYIVRQLAAFIITSARYREKRPSSGRADACNCSVEAQNVRSISRAASCINM